MKKNLVQRDLTTLGIAASCFGVFALFSGVFLRYKLHVPAKGDPITTEMYETLLNAFQAILIIMLPFLGVAFLICAYIAFKCIRRIKKGVA